MDFTIEVEKKSEKVNLRALDILHKDCGGGKLKVQEIRAVKGDIDFFFERKKFIELTCGRCQRRVWVRQNENLREKIFGTAVDGQIRKFSFLEGRISRRLTKRIIDSSNSVGRVIQREVEKKKPEEKIEEIHCPYCGGQLMPKGTYCPSCGANLSDRVSELTIEKTEQE